MLKRLIVKQTGELIKPDEMKQLTREEREAKLGTKIQGKVPLLDEADAKPAKTKKKVLGII
jgi:hypothetical protein